jgi:putative acyl-CoA dehydrogenase
LRAFSREPEAARALIGELAREARPLPGVAEAAEFIAKISTMEANEARARALTERLAQLAAAAALAAGPAKNVAAAYARTRLRDGRGATYGTAQLDSAETSLVLDRILSP